MIDPFFGHFAPSRTTLFEEFDRPASNGKPHPNDEAPAGLEAS
jgi:hypothetical protein